MRLISRLTAIAAVFAAIAALFAGPAAAVPNFERLLDRDEWFTVYQGETPVGTIHSTVVEIQKKGGGRNALFKIRNEMASASVTAGKQLANRFYSEETIDGNLRLQSFETEADIGGRSVKMSGKIQDEMIGVEITTGGANGRKVAKQVALPLGCIPMSLLPIFLASFDPPTSGSRGVCTVSYESDDITVGRTWAEAPEASGTAWVYRIKSPGYGATLTMTRDGKVLEEVQPTLGIVTRRVKNGQPPDPAAWDPTGSNIVPANMSLVGPEELRFLRIELVWKGIAPASLTLDSDMQSFSPVVEKNGWFTTVVTVKRKTPQTPDTPGPAVSGKSTKPDGKTKPKNMPENKKTTAGKQARNSGIKDPAAFLDGDSVILAGNPVIVKTAKNIVGEETDPERRAELLAVWIYKEIRPDPRSWSKLRNAADVLKQRRGSAKHRALLFASMARSLGIPTKICCGKWYSFGAFVDHVWNEIYAGGAWRTIDASYPTRDEPPLIIKIAETAHTSGLSSVFPAIDATLSLRINDYGR
jgi:transglutaminase-like putative cysteine protease